MMWRETYNIYVFKLICRKIRTIIAYQFDNSIFDFFNIRKIEIIFDKLQVFFNNFAKLLVLFVNWRNSLQSNYRS